MNIKRFDLCYNCANLMKSWGRLTWHRIVLLTLYSETIASRFWFGLLSIGYASMLAFSTSPHAVNSPYLLMFDLAPDWVWIVGFTTHGLSLIYGAFTRKYNTFLLLLEGVLGVACWSAAGATTTIAQGAPGGTTVGALISLWVLVRYPTHHEWENNEECYEK